MTNTASKCRATFGETTLCRHCNQPIHLAAIGEDGWQIWAHEVIKGCKTACDDAKTVAAP